MKFYLSSYKLGNEVARLKELIPANTKTAYISNALDYSDDQERRKKSEQSDIDALSALGLEVQILDLRNYFQNHEALKKEIREFGVIWVRGGNLFVLRQAMFLSGFDTILKTLVKESDLLYGGYSAGVCVLAPTLKGIDLMDDLTVKPYGDQVGIIWDGLGIIDYSVVPHFQSDHPESALADHVAQYMTEHHLPFKTLKDGDVIIIE